MRRLRVLSLLSIVLLIGGACKANEDEGGAHGSASLDTLELDGSPRSLQLQDQQLGVSRRVLDDEQVESLRHEDLP